MEKQKTHGTAPNDICIDCLKWEKYGTKCSVFWEGKKWCTLKVTSMFDWQQQNMMLDRNY